jgi:hypothetical protein
MKVRDIIEQIEEDGYSILSLLKAATHNINICQNKAG